MIETPVWRDVWDLGLAYLCFLNSVEEPVRGERVEIGKVRKWESEKMRKWENEKMGKWEGYILCFFNDAPLFRRFLHIDQHTDYFFICLIEDLMSIFGQILTFKCEIKPVLCFLPCEILDLQTFCFIRNSVF